MASGRRPAVVGCRRRRLGALAARPVVAVLAVAHSPDLPASLAGFLVLEDFATPEEVRQLKERGEELVSWLARAAALHTS